MVQIIIIIIIFFFFLLLLRTDPIYIDSPTLPDMDTAATYKQPLP